MKARQYLIIGSMCLCLSAFGQRALTTKHPADGHYNAQATKIWDLIHTKLELRPDWSKSYLYGTASLKLTPHFYPQNTIDLDAKGFEILALTVNDTTQKYSYDGKIIKVTLGRIYYRTDTLELKIKYIAKPNERKLTGSEAITSDKGLYFINPAGNKPRQLWTQGETQSSSCWFPTLDAPNQKSTEEIYLTVENQIDGQPLTTLSNGLLIDSKMNNDSTRTDYWKQIEPHAPYLFMIAVGNFKKVIDPHSQKFEISYFVEPKYANTALQIFGRTPDMIQYFEEILGIKYPWSKYAQIAVRDYVSGAMENTTATIHGENIQKNARQLIDDNDDGVIAHELFHHWFGDLVTCESWANLSLNESFADYAEYLWAAHKYGKDAADLVAENALNQYLNEAKNTQEPLIRYHYLDKEAMFDATTYAKGGRILHLLRKTVGDDAFFKSLNRYLTQHKFGTAELADLRIAFEQTTGEDLNWFFEQWFLRAGHPQLAVQQSYANGNVLLQIKQTQDTTATPIYQLPIEINIWVNDSKKSQKIILTNAAQTFVFPTPQKPNLVLIDPGKILVGTLKHEKTKVEWLYQYYHAEGYVARLEALKQLSENQESNKKTLQDREIRRVLMAATQDNFWKIRQYAVSKFSDYKGDDFLAVEKSLRINMADTHSLVRSEAILAMKNFESSTNLALFRRALNDSSYAVQAAALEALLKNKVPDAAVLAAKFENTDDPDIFAVVADYYADTAEPKYLPWFEQQIQQYSEGDLYRVIGTFGAYLVKSAPDIQLKSLPLLEKIAKNSSQYYLRYIGVQTLLLLISDNEMVNVQTKKIIKEVIANETNPQLQKTFKELNY